MPESGGSENWKTFPMETPAKPANANLFQVYLRLRPQAEATKTPGALSNQQPERYLIVEPAGEDCEDGLPKHITVSPPTDSRRRAVEKYTFTKVFEEGAGQIDVFHGTGVVPLVEGVLGSNGGCGRDGLLATLGVTGSGKVTA
jgi:hypothetical protein